MAWILHVDLDQFLAAVEIRRRPELRGKPVIVGGDGDPRRPRQVVATASYEARAFGVRSGMPLTVAARKCPDGVFLPADHPVYEEASAEVMETLRAFPVVVEVWGWDEAFVGAETADPEALAGDIRATLLRETGLSCSIGIGDTKTRAKIATGFAKPAGVFRLTAENWPEVMYARPVEALWGIGRKMAKNLAELDIRTVGELATADLSLLKARFGPTMGVWYVMLGRGLGDTEVTDVPRVAKSRSKEKTYPADLTDAAEIRAEVAALARAVTDEIVAEGREVVRVAVKLRYRSFYTPTKIRKLPEPTTDPDAVASAALAIVDAFDLTRPIRLLGVRAELDPR